MFSGVALASSWVDEEVASNAGSNGSWGSFPVLPLRNDTPEVLPGAGQRLLNSCIREAKGVETFPQLFWEKPFVVVEGSALCPVDVCTVGGILAIGKG